MALPGHEFRWSSNFHNPPGTQNNNAIRLADCGESVSDDEGGSVLG
jgi:hypothetical protein